jgi:hypothetical protein
MPDTKKIIKCTVLLIVLVLFGPLIFLVVFGLVGSTFSSGSVFILGDLTKKPGSKFIKLFSFFFNKPKDSENTKLLRFFFIQLPIGAVIFGILFWSSITWTRFVFLNLFSVDIVGVINKFLY